MKNRFEILLKSSICILLTIILSGCWNRRELDTLAIVMGVGVDKSDAPGKIRITTQIVKPAEIKTQGKDSGGIGAQAFWNLSGTGDTVFSTLREMTDESNRKLFFPHNQIIIFSRAIAKKGIQKYIDFFTRDPETRVNALVLISKGNASDILNVKSEMEKIPANNIAKLITAYSDATSQTNPEPLRALIPGLMSKTTASTVPFIKISENDNKKIVMISDTAVFKIDKLVGSLNKTEGRGLMWVLGKVKSGIIVVSDSNKDKVCIEIIRASSKMMPILNKKRITIKVNIFEEGNLGEQQGPKNLSKLKNVALLQRKIAAAIRNEVMESVKKSKKLDADVFGFGEAVHKKYPKQWKSLEENWDKTFKTIQVKVTVEAKLRLMGRELVPTVPQPKPKPKKEKK